MAFVPPKPVPRPIPGSQGAPPIGGPQPVLGVLADTGQTARIVALEMQATALRNAILTNSQFVAANATSPNAIPATTLAWLEFQLTQVIAAQNALIQGAQPPSAQAQAPTV
jgi:hypothetical protein